MEILSTLHISKSQLAHAPPLQGISAAKVTPAKINAVTILNLMTAIRLHQEMV
jgi:hypothetical protein